MRRRRKRHSVDGSWSLLLFWLDWCAVVSILSENTEPFSWSDPEETDQTRW